MGCYSVKRQQKTHSKPSVLIKVHNCLLKATLIDFFGSSTTSYTYNIEMVSWYKVVVVNMLAKSRLFANPADKISFHLELCF